MNSTPPPPLVDRIERPGNPLALAALALVAAIAIVAIWFAPSNARAPILTTEVFALALCGVLGLLLFSFGLLGVPIGTSRSDSARAIVDTSPDGIVVTDRQSGILYANEAYRALTGPRSTMDLKPVERAFAGPPEISESVYRLSQASKAGKSASEELRLAPSLNGESDVAWYRIRVRPLEGVMRHRATVWTVSDETREHQRHESFFQDLQHAIDYLDHAPAGFFSTDQDGAVVYMNATLAEWLDFDLAQFGLGQLKIDDIIAGTAANPET